MRERRGDPITFPFPGTTSLSHSLAGGASDLAWLPEQMGSREKQGPHASPVFSGAALFQRRCPWGRRGPGLSVHLSPGQEECPGPLGSRGVMGSGGPSLSRPQSVPRMPHPSPGPHALTQRDSMGLEQVAGVTLPGELWGSAEHLCSGSSRDAWHSLRRLPAPSPGMDLESKTRPALHPQPQVCTGGDDSKDHERGEG